MRARTPTSDQVPGTQPLRHWASRLEDRFHAVRERRGRRRGLVPTIVPYTGYGSAEGWIRVLARVVLVRPSAVARGPQYKRVRGWRSFLSIPVKHSLVTVRVNGESHQVRADRGGVLDADLRLALPAGWHTIEVEAAEAEPVTAPMFVADPTQRVGILSDIDDTVMVTALPRPFLAAWNTFVLDEHARRPVAGMAVLYERLKRHYPGAPVLYLSTGAWNVAPTLGRFLSRNLYPAGALLLTDWGPTTDRFFRSGREHKHEQLRRIAHEFPDVRWILIGDDGQHDEQLYGQFATEHGANVAAVAIRQLSAGEAVFAGGRSKARDLAERTKVPWVYAPDGAGLAAQLAAIGLLPGGAPVTEARTESIPLPPDLQG
jgi:phosphatidate phosphatase APP1